MSQESLPQKTFFYCFAALFAAAVLVLLVNAYFIIRYQPQYRATTDLVMRTFAKLPASQGDRDLSQADRDKLDAAKKQAEKRLPELERLVRSSEAMQRAEDACRAQQLVMADYLPSQFAKRVDIRRYGLQFTLAFTCDDPGVTSAVVNALSRFIQEKYGGTSYETTSTFYEQLSTQLTNWKRFVSDRTTAHQRLVNEVRASNPEYDFSKTVKKAQADRMQSLADTVINHRATEVIHKIRIETLESMETKQPRFFDGKLIGELENQLADLEKERREAEQELIGICKEIAGEDAEYPRIETARLEESKARVVERELEELIEQLNGQQYFEAEAPATTPEKPISGRPALPMILSSALAILLPFALAFFLLRRAEAQALEA